MKWCRDGESKPTKGIGEVIVLYHHILVSNQQPLTYVQEGGSKRNKSHMGVSRKAKGTKINEHQLRGQPQSIRDRLTVTENIPRDSRSQNSLVY